MPLRESLCANFCAYFKPGKTEDLACRGYTLVERLLLAGRVRAFEKTNRAIKSETRESIVQNLCTACDFQIDGCDFMLDRQARPCGGFAFLAQLIEVGSLTIDDLKKS